LTTTRWPTGTAPSAYPSNTWRTTQRYVGEASIYQEGDLRQQVWDRTVKPERDRDPECQGVAVVIKVNTILSAAGDVLQQR
jgi:hypothetical protein